MVIPNNTQTPAVVFLSKDTIARDPQVRANVANLKAAQTKATAQTPEGGGRTTPQLRHWRTSDHDPLDVMRALGNLVLVGRNIQYMQRVRVIGPPSGTTPPVVISVDPQEVVQGQKARLIITGAALVNGAIAIDDFTITNTTTLLNGNELQADFTVSSTASPGDHTITVRTSDPTPDTSKKIRVKAGTPTVEKAASVTAAPGETADFTVKGTFLNLLTTPVAAVNGKFNVQITHVQDDGTSADYSVAVPADATEGDHDVQLSTRDGAVKVKIATVTVKKARAVVTGSDPPAPKGPQATGKVVVTLSGTLLSQLKTAVAKDSSGKEVSTLQCTLEAAAGDATRKLDIVTNATAKGTYDIHLFDGDGQDCGKFTFEVQ